MPHLSDETNVERRKRRRKALSCLECRRRKVRCDRRYPCCNRCQEAGDMTICIYTPEARKAQDEEVCSSGADSELIYRPMKSAAPYTPSSTTTGATHDASENLTSTLRTQARKIAELEDRLSSLEVPIHQSFKSNEIPTRAPHRVLAALESRREKYPAKAIDEPSEVMIFKGKDFKTRFIGAGSPFSVLFHFPELAPFLREAYASHQGMAQGRSELKVFTLQRKNLVGAGNSCGVVSLLSLIPARDVADVLLKKYLEGVEPIYHILHLPTFLKEYEDFWVDPQKSRPTFIVIVLLVIAAVSCIWPEDTIIWIGDSSRGRESALRRIEACDAWVERQSLKHLTMAIFQIRCLSLIAKQMNQMKMKAYYTNAGTLLRAGLVAGLHRDPKLPRKKQSAFNQEMRSRLFSTMIELELQASIDRGLPSMTAGLSFDCPPPSNIHDSDFDPSTENLSSPIPEDEFTKSSYLLWSRKSLLLRIRICQLINDNTTPLTFEDVLNLHDQITSHLESIPRWSTPEAANSHLTLDVQLRQLLLILHAPFARQLSRPKPASARSELSRSVCLSASSSIISQHVQLSAATTCSNHSPMLLRNDVFRAALCLSCAILVGADSPIPPPEQNIDVLFFNLGYSHAPQLASALKLLKEKLLRLGRGYQDMVLVSGAYSLVMATLIPDQLELQKKEAIERVAKLFRQVVANQSTEGESLPVGTGRMDVQTETEVEQLRIEIPRELDMGLVSYDYEDIQSWAYNEFWPFDPMDEMETSTILP